MTKSEPGSKNTSMSVTGWISRLNIESGIRVVTPIQGQAGLVSSPSKYGSAVIRNIHQHPLIVYLAEFFMECNE